MLEGALPPGVEPGFAWIVDQARPESISEAVFEATQTACASLEPRRPTQVIEVAIEGGDTVRVLVELHEPSVRLLLIGAGHIAQALSVYAERLGYRLVVFDDLPERLNPDIFPKSAKFISGSFEDAGELLEAGPKDCAVIVSRAHSGDGFALQSLAPRNLAYLGMIGSKRKVGKLMEKAREAGITEDCLGRVHSPIGLSIGAQTPDEIAISIVAEIIAVVRGEDPALAGSCSLLAELHPKTD